jgi:hypothetical protein
MSLLGRLFPETIFPRKLSGDTAQRLRLAAARAEEQLVRTHVANALLFVDALAPEVGYERALDIYVRELGVAEPLASVVVGRALVTLGEALMPRPAAEPAQGAPALPLPALRLEAGADREPGAGPEPRRRRA